MRTTVEPRDGRAGEASARLDPSWRFAVIDLETTGLEPGPDRVIECAIVEVDATATVCREFSTLVAIPGRHEPGAQFVHGISRPMLEGAPRFASIAGEIIARLAGRIVVGHVVSFDLAHLAAEFAHVQLAMPDLSAASLCTRELSLQLFEEGSRSLAGCCAKAGIAFAHPHTALGDARATAALMAWALHQPHGLDVAAMARAARQPWPVRAPGAPAELSPRTPAPG